MKLHGPAGGQFVLAPWYILAMVIGTTSSILALSGFKNKQEVEHQELETQEEGVALAEIVHTNTWQHPRRKLPDSWQLAEERSSLDLAACPDAGGRGSHEADEPVTPVAYGRAWSAPIRVRSHSRMDRVFPKRQRTQEPNQKGGVSDVENQRTAEEQTQSGTLTLRRLLLGLLAASISAILANHKAVLHAAERFEKTKAGCTDEESLCPDIMIEQFDNFGSYNASFGIGCIIVATVQLVILAAFNKLTQQALPKLHFKLMIRWGTLAGSLWTAGNFSGRLAISRAGGPAFTMPMSMAMTTVACGAWGILFYKETSSFIRAAIWFLAAAFTVCFVILLGEEAGKLPVTSFASCAVCKAVLHTDFGSTFLFHFMYSSWVTIYTD